MYQTGEDDPQEEAPVASLHIKMKGRKGNHQSETLSHPIERLQIARIKEDKKENAQWIGDGKAPYALKK